MCKCLTTQVACCCCNCALSILLSVIFFVVIAMIIIAVAVYFGLYDVEKGSHLDQAFSTVNDWTDKAKEKVNN